MGGTPCSSFLRRTYTRGSIDHTLILVRDHRKGIEARRSVHPDVIDCTLRTYARHIGLERGYAAHSMRATCIMTVSAVCVMRARLRRQAIPCTGTERMVDPCTLTCQHISPIYQPEVSMASTRVSTGISQDSYRVPCARGGERRYAGWRSTSAQTVTAAGVRSMALYR
jgi:hypothetical protein